ncbi:MAG: hypothetical protein ABL872_15840 [Lacibacter sp.]
MKYLFTERFSTTLQVIALVCLISYSGFTANRDSQMKSLADSTFIKQTAAELKITMHNLWDDNATWTRTVLLCYIDDLPGKEQATKRLLQNQEEIGNSIKPYYGLEAGRKLTLLLNNHLQISAEMVYAAKSKNIQQLKEVNKSWHENAEEISAFLSKRNSEWTFTDLKEIMNQQIKLITDQVQLRMNKNYDADIIAYDKVHAEILKMSVLISNGIVKQFPEKFVPQVAATASK